MRLLVLAALAAVAVADVSELTGYQYNPPASSYGVPQNSVTGKQFLNVVPTSPSPALNLPAFEHQDFNANIDIYNPISGPVVSTTAAPIIDTGFLSSTPAPSVDAGFAVSTPAPSISVTSGSQENLNFGYNPGFGFYSTPAPAVFSTPAPEVVSTPAPISFNSGLSFGGGYNFPIGYNLGLGAFSTPAPISFGYSTPAPVVYSQPIQTQAAQVSKHVYFYAAPEEPELPRPRVSVIPSAPARKTVKLIFIKAPAPPAPSPIRIAAPPQNEEKTVVYVLVKKPEEQQNIEVQAPPATPPSKPEVYFIKYKSQKEAEEAISRVQGEQGSGPQVIADTVSGPELVGSISKESSVTTLPIINYISTTPAPVVSFAPFPTFDTSFKFGPQFSESDISQNLISSGDQTPLFSPAAPVTVSTVEPTVVSSTTPTPIVPHVTYGPPGFKK